jgi:hypothetical protein
VVGQNKSKTIFNFSKTTKSGLSWAANRAAEWYAKLTICAYHSAAQSAAQL